MRLSDPDAKLVFINPYTYNPSALTTSDYNSRRRVLTQPIPKSLLTYKSEILPPKLPQGSNSYYWCAINDPDKSERKRFRNELQNAIISVVKENTATHLSELKATENSGNLLLGASTIGLSGAAAVSPYASTARAFAAAASGTAGARGLFNEQVYRQTFAEGIIKLIQGNQLELAGQLRDWQTNSIDVYPVEAAISDAKEFENRGSFYNGMALMQKAIGEYTNVDYIKWNVPTPNKTN